MMEVEVLVNIKLRKNVEFIRDWIMKPNWSSQIKLNNLNQETDNKLVFIV